MCRWRPLERISVIALRRRRARDHVASVDKLRPWRGPGYLTLSTNGRHFAASRRGTAPTAQRS